ncbi:MAG: DUF1134 domain-containing protein [Alphaproteobacteria bacterium]
MDRRALITAAGALAVTGCSTTTSSPNSGGFNGNQSTGDKVATYTRDELVPAVSDFFGVTVESAGAVIEKVFGDNGRPTGYIAGEEGSAALTVGARYGRGLLYMKAEKDPKEVFWQGPSVGFDAGANASRTFILCYNLFYPDAIYRRVPGVEGSAYFIGGLGVNYMRGDGLTLAPIRAGVGLRLGANVGYLSFSRQRNALPF